MLFALDRRGVVIGRGAIFTLLGKRQITVNWDENVRAERLREAFLKLIRGLQIRRDQHKREIRFRRDDTEREKLRRIRGADFLD